MPFGKYKGVPIVDLDTDYCRWMLTQGWLRSPLRELVEKKVALKEETRRERPPMP